MLVSQSIFACVDLRRSIVQRSIVQESVEKRLMGKELLQLSNAVKVNM